MLLRIYLVRYLMAFRTSFLFVCLATVCAVAQDTKVARVDKKPARNNAYAAPSLSYKNLRFEDPGKNYLISARENARIIFKMINKGNATAHGVDVRASVGNGAPGIAFPKQIHIVSLLPGDSILVVIPLLGTEKIEAGVANLVVEIKEASRPAADQLSLDVPTEEFSAPDLQLVSYSFARVANPSGDNPLAELVPFALRLQLQNRGKGDALGVQLVFSLPDYAKTIDQSSFKIPFLKAGESREVTFKFLISKQSGSVAVPIKIAAREQYQQYGQEAQVQLHLDQESEMGQIQPIIKTSALSADSVEVTAKHIDKAAGFHDAVDQDIPINPFAFSNRFALIIGNQIYPHRSATADSSFAQRDAETFREYCIKTLGVPSSQIIFHLNASGKQFIQGLQQLNTITKGQAGKAELIIYYAGRGVAGNESEELYLVPVDADNRNTRGCLALGEMYALLLEHPSNRITIVLETSFDLKVKEDYTQNTLSGDPIRRSVPNRNMITLAASNISQRAWPYPEKGHGLFTYFLLQSLRESEGAITYGSLIDFITEKVVTKSALIHRTEQTPQVFTGKGTKKDWDGWTVR
jgi:hypothetical protein